MNSKRPQVASVRRWLLPLVALGALGTAQPGPAVPGDADADYTVISGSGNVSAQTLRTAIAPLFTDEALGTTQSLLVMRDGAVIAERYGEGIAPGTPLLSRSVGKCVTAALVGLMVSDGRLALDSPVPVGAWDQPGDPRGGITLRHLLTMTSGLEHREAGDPLASSDTVRMLFTDGAHDMAAFAEAKPIAAKPGTQFNYSTADTQILSDLLTRMLTDSTDPDVRRAAMMDFVRGRLIEPVGLKSLTPEFDARGTMIGGAMLHMTTRDYGRLGEFLRQKGRAGGRQILSARWVDFMTHASARNPAYGGHLWVNREGTGNPLFPGRGSRGLFACVGHHGQYVIVSPAQRLVVVRMGLTAEEQMGALRGALAGLVEQFPAG
ncbi:serine hydrolase domain-containing protein [Sphingobium subterraneum]|uniref:CubicO group peptidase (Beta-lactamase class C family) n=1 Tax=Sphingobium subterraneum TaxID=627688 RepID=A0A841J6N1_9SPHN|nr:serine hydrolase [Sphingobium subterraneum]MBB6123861.1 CubicO group peptidase (beta-lactamase class C family) [Sphingobium subterraneum]